MQLERKREALEKQGIKVASLTNDNSAMLKHFGERVGIGYPMLADPDSTMIRAFRILNTTVAEDHAFYGIANPGQYLINADGTVRGKYFEEDYTDRFTAGEVLVRELGVDLDSDKRGLETDHLQVESWASDDLIRGGNRVALVVDVDLHERMHVYAPGVEGYIPIDWKMEETPGVTSYDVEYPEAEVLELPAIQESAPVYEGRFRMVRDVMIGQPKEVEHLVDADGVLSLRGTLRYQACDDKICYLPQTIDLEWRFKLEQHDRTRVPEELRK